MLLFYAIILFIFFYFLGTKLKYFPLYFIKDTFSIGIMRGDSPFLLKDCSKMINPIIKFSDINDFTCRFVADPFLYFSDNTYFIFYEAMDMNLKRAKICYSYSSDLKNWIYGGIAISEKYHLSYPYLFEYNNKIFLIPETHQKCEVRLYECLDFPNQWEYRHTLLKGKYCEPSIVFHDSNWYLFLTEMDSSCLRLFYSDQLTDNWKEHPKSPIVLNDKSKARSAGRIINYKSSLYRFSQDCTNIYGENIRAHNIKIMSKLEYKEEEYSKNPILKPTGRGWNSHRTHHIDVSEESPDNWLGVVDGLKRERGIFFK